MANPTQLWPGERMKRFFRSVFVADPQVDAVLAERLAERTSRYVNRMIVWDLEPQAEQSPADNTAQDQALRSAKSGRPTRRKRGKRAGTRSPAAQADLPGMDTEAGAPWIAPDAVSDDSAPNDGSDATGNFDPHAFSAVVVLARQGEKGLRALLTDIKEASHLRQLAEAQHLGVEQTVTGVADLREAIVQGALQRIADRRAAAS